MASIAQTAIQIAQLVKRVIDLINLSNENNKHMKEIKFRMQSIAGILERLSRLPDGDREDLEQSIGGVSETLEEVEGFVLARTKKPKDGRFSKIASLWNRGNAVFSAEQIKASLNELDNKMQLHLQVLIAAQGQAQLKRQAEMADALKSLSSSMFAFSLPAVSMSSQSLALPPLPEQAAPPSRFGVRGRVTRQPPHRRETGSIAGRSVTTTSPADPRISRVTGPRRSNGRPSLGASESGERQGSEGQSERRAGDESDASPDSEEVDVDVRTPAPGDEKPTASTTLASPDLRAPLLRVDSGSSAIETDPDDADLVLVNSYERRERLYGVIKYLEIAAHQFIIGAFICACAMLSPHQDGRISVLILAPCFPVLIMLLLMIQAKTLSKAVLVFGLRSLMDKAFLTYTLYGWPCWAALVGMTTTGQLEGQPLEAFHTCLYGLSVGIGAYLVGRFLTTPTDTQAGAARA